MNRRRLRLDGEALALWQPPELDGPKPALPPLAAPAAEGLPAPAPLPPPQPPLVDERASAEEALRRAYEQKLSEGYAVGLERGMSEGRERGHAAGFAEGRKEAERIAGEEVRRLEAIVRRLKEPMRSLDGPVEEAVVALALEVARGVIGSEVTRSREPLIKLIREAIAKVPVDVGTPKVLLNPVDAQLVRRLSPDLESNGVLLVDDETIEPGGCLVVADGADGVDMKDRRWHLRARRGVSQVDLTLASRWRDIMLILFDGEEA